MKAKKVNSRLDSVLKALLIVFISLLAFSFGVYAGKTFSDKQYQHISLNNREFNTDKFKPEIREETGAEPTLSQKEIEELAEDTIKTAQLDAEDEMKVPTAAEASATSSASREVASEHPEAHAATGAHAAPAAHGAGAAAARIAHDQTPTEPAKAKVISAPAALPTTVGMNEVEFTVQVASYGTEGEAAKHAASLMQKGFPAFSVPAQINGRTWYRVSVGTFKNSVDATKFRAQLLSQAGVKTAIVQRITR